MNGRSQNVGHQAAAAGDQVDLESGDARWARSDDQVLELDGLGTPVQLLKGQRVRVQTIWGHEGGMVLDIKHGDPDVFPLAQVLMDKGDTIYINVARCTPEEEES